MSWSWKEYAILCIVLVSILLIAYIIQVYERFTYYIHHQNHNNSDILEIMKANPYRPTMYLPSAWLKMIYWFDKKIRIPAFTREKFIYSDGGEIALDYYPKDFNKLDTPILIIIPGLNGYTEDSYCLYIAKRAMDKLGFRTVVWNKRGYAGIPLKGKHWVQWSRYQDFESVIQHLKNNNPGSLIFTMGLSMGANFTEFYLGIKGSMGEPTGITASVAISPPHNMYFGARKVAKNKPLLKAMLKAYIKEILNSEGTQTLEALLDQCNLTANELRNMTSLKDLDDRWSSKTLGMSCAEEYYEYISGCTRLEHVATPLLCISSERDPIIAHEGLAIDKILHNPNIFQVVVRNGGHIEYCHGCNNDNWAVLRGLDYFKHILNTHSLI